MIKIVRRAAFTVLLAMSMLGTGCGETESGDRSEPNDQPNPSTSLPDTQTTLPDLQPESGDDGEQPGSGEAGND